MQGKIKCICLVKKSRWKISPVKDHVKTVSRTRSGLKKMHSILLFLSRTRSARFARVTRSLYALVASIACCNHRHCRHYQRHYHHHQHHHHLHHHPHHHHHHHRRRRRRHHHHHHRRRRHHHYHHHYRRSRDNTTIIHEHTENVCTVG